MSEDPFAHLHDERYADGFAAGRVGAQAMVAMGGRKRIPLAGAWRITPDLYDEGLRQQWYLCAADDPSGWTRPRDYDEGGAEAVPVPSCWNLLKPEWKHFEGSMWYARAFTWPPMMHGERLALRVGAANYEARVFLNGRFVGAHRGGSTPFFADLTPALRAGANALMIQVENRRRADRVPMHHTDWFNYGGLYREVDLLVLPPTFIRRAEAALVPDGTLSRIRVSIGLSAPAAGMAEVEIPALGLAAAVPIEGGRGEAMLAARPEPWSVATPRLYDVVFRFGADRVQDRIGFREIRADGERLVLNGRKLTLRGISVHEDDAERGKCTDEADLRRRFAHVRELGANFLRLAHSPHHERVAEIADAEGVLLWSEIPVYWAIDFANPETYADAENQLLELIGRDANRASVIAWGVGNENADTDARYRFMAALAEAARRADATRLVGAACLINRGEFAIADRLAAHLDLIGLNEYFGWYEPDFAGLERLLANSHPGKPVLISETGADALAGHRGGIHELFTEDCQAEIYRRQLEIVGRAAFVQGFCPWLLYDFRTERRQNRFQHGWNRKGLIAEDKVTKKLAFEVLARHYHAGGRRNDAG
jgi:beta-glucuronidase